MAASNYGVPAYRIAAIVSPPDPFRFDFACCVKTFVIKTLIAPSLSERSFRYRKSGSGPWARSGSCGPVVPAAQVIDERAFLSDHTGSESNKMYGPTSASVMVLSGERMDLTRFDFYVKDFLASENVRTSSRDGQRSMGRTPEPACNPDK